MELLKEMLQLNMISAKPSSATTPIDSTNGTKIPMQSTAKFGNKLSIASDGGIKIGSGVSFVKVSANLAIQITDKTAGLRRLRIVKNNTVITNIANHYNADVTYINLVQSPITVDVKEGDILYLLSQNASNNDIAVRSGTGSIGSTSMMVEVIQ